MTTSILFYTSLFFTVTMPAALLVLFLVTLGIHSGIYAIIDRKS